MGVEAAVYQQSEPILCPLSKIHSTHFRSPPMEFINRISPASLCDGNHEVTVQ